MSADPTLSLDERKLVKAVREARLSPFHLRLAIGAMREAVGRLAALSADELRFFYDWVMTHGEEGADEESARGIYEETRRERDAAADAVVAGRRGAVIDWRVCPHVWIDADRVSGAVCFKGTRLPVGHLFENLIHGATVEQFIEWYPTDDPEQIPAVLRWVFDGLKAARDTSLDRHHAGAPPDAER